jgi:hypothetical protein
MSKIGKLWAGGIAGTNTGKVFAEFDHVDDDKIKGTLRVRDDQFGLTIYAVSGTFDGSKLRVTGTCTQAPEGIATGEITVDGALTAAGGRISAMAHIIVQEMRSRAKEAGR